MYNLNRALKVWIVLISFFLHYPMLCFSQSLDQALSSSPRVIPRINGPVTLDGISDEAVWEGIEPLPLSMHRPVFMGEQTERTEIFLGYDDDYVYAAGRFFESDPSKMQSRTGNAIQ